MPHFGQRNVCANVKHNAVHRIHGKREQRAAPEPIEQLCFLGFARIVETCLLLGRRGCFGGCFCGCGLRLITAALAFASASRAQPQRDACQPRKHSAQRHQKLVNQAGAANQVKQPRFRRIARAGVFHAELVCPCHQRAKKQLVVGQNHARHGHNHPAYGS